MGLKEWWAGGPKIAEAKAIIAKLQEKKAKKGLKPSENGRLNDAISMERRIFLGQIAVVLGGLGLVVGGGSALEFLISKEEKVIPQLKEAIPPLELNGFIFIFDQEFSKEEYEKIKNVFIKATPVIMEYLPEQKNLGKEIKVNKVIHDVSNSSYQIGEFNINPTATEGLITHELIHMLHGEKDCLSDLVEEGLATGISILTTQKLGMETWGAEIEDIQMNDALENGGLSVLGSVSFIKYQPLLALRLLISSKFWLELEKAQPGFIRKYHEDYYEFLEEGGDKIEFASELFIPFAQKIAPEVFDKIADGNPMMRFDPTPRDLVYVHYIHFKNNQKRMHINIVSKGSDGGEMPYREEKVSFKFMNMDNGKFSQDSFTYTDDQGELVLNINEILEQEVEVSSRYKLIYTVREETEEFEFTVK